MSERPTELEALLTRVPPETRAMIEALSRVCADAERVIAAYQEAVRRVFQPSAQAWAAMQALGVEVVRGSAVVGSIRHVRLRVRSPRREARRAHRRKLKRGR